MRTCINILFMRDTFFSNPDCFYKYSAYFCTIHAVMSKIKLTYLGVLAVLAICSCRKLGDEFDIPVYDGNERKEAGERVTGEIRKALILYMCGYNSLSQYITEDIEDLLSGDIPLEGRNRDLLFIYSHLPSAYSNYSTPTSPSLTRICKDMDGNIIRDTVLRLPVGTISSSAATLKDVLGYIKDNYPARGYGLLFSSHATGWLPAGYYSNSGYYDSSNGAGVLTGAATGLTPVPVPYVAPEYNPDEPAVRSIGQDQVYTGSQIYSYEMNIKEFADAIPMKLDYILFDACLMGGIEIAYELKDICGSIGFSQAEVLAEGFNYKTLTSRLLTPKEPDPVSVCRDYFEYYDAREGMERSATISVVDCTKLEQLAEVCSELFAKYRSGMDSVRPSEVQNYFRSNKHWFYDLADILEKSGASDGDMSRLNAALDECLPYKAATPQFITIPIDKFSGFSMYLPCNGSSYLDDYYSDLKWNLASGLVK